MNMPILKARREQTYDKQHLKIVQESFQGIRFGFFPSFMYDPSNPETGYVGGEERWENFIGSTEEYQFPRYNRYLLSNRGGEIADAILADTNHHLSAVPWHFFSLTPGNKFGTQDFPFLTAMKNAVEANATKIAYLTIDEGNDNFREKSKKFAHENADISTENILESGRDIYQTSLAETVPDHLKQQNRRSVVLWSGGTVGNVAYKAGDSDFPDDSVIETLHMQVDYTARECYIVVLHNSYTDKGVETYYSEPVHAEFAMGSMHGIKEHLPTENFEPDNFSYKPHFNEKTEVLEHVIFSNKNQRFFIGKTGFEMEEGEQACIIGHSAQISNDRMGNISAKGGFTRVASFPMPQDPRTIATVIKATPELMNALKHGYKYRRSFP